MLSQRQEEIITGSLLGDGTIWTNFVDPLMKFQLSQSKKDYVGVDKKQYMGWFVSEFMEIGCSVRPKKVYPGGVIKDKNKEYHQYVFTTKCNEFWCNLEKEWYVPRGDHWFFKRRKIVPNNIKLTPLTLCIWHMEDGSSDAKSANMTLETQSFTEIEVEFLIEKLKQDLGIDANKKKARNGQFRIYIGRNNYFKFIEIIKPFVEWDCFQYKIDTETYDKKPHRGEDHSMSKLNEEKIKKMFELRKQGMEHKDIAKQFNITPANVSLILSGDRWSHLGIEPIKVLRKPRLSKEGKKEIIKLHEQGLEQLEISKIMDCHQTTVSRTLSGKHK